MVAMFAITLPSCNSSGKKYEYLSQQIPATMAAVDVLGSAKMNPDKFYQFIEDNFDKSDAQRTDNGMVALFRWKDNAKYTLSDGEKFYCCAMFDFNRNPYELTLSNFGMVYESSSTENANEYYSVAMSQLKPLMENWGFKEVENLKTSTNEYYIKDKESITINKKGNEIIISRTFK